MSEWYFAKNNQKHGPVDISVIMDLLYKKELAADSLVWTSSLGDSWKRISEVEQFSGHLSAPPGANIATSFLAQATAKVDNGPAEAPPPPAPSVWPRRVAKLVFLLLVAAGGFFGWRHFFYKSGAAQAYMKFAQAYYEYKYEEALNYCADGPARKAVMEKIAWMNALRNPPQNKLARALTPGPPEILNKKYTVLSEKKNKEAGTRELKVKQGIRITTNYSPYQAIMISEHTAIMTEVNGEWKVVSFAINPVGAFNPMSGQPL